MAGDASFGLYVSGKLAVLDGELADALVEAHDEGDEPMPHCKACSPNLVQIRSSSGSQWLHHSLTGEQVELPESPSPWSLYFSPAGYGYVTNGEATQWVNDHFKQVVLSCDEGPSVLARSPGGSEVAEWLSEIHSELCILAGWPRPMHHA